jgi:4'-phosphopantetheinyl transferase
VRLNSDVAIWDVDLDGAAAAVDQLRRILSPDERQRANRFRFEVHRHRYIACRAALRHIVASRLHCSPRDIQFGYGRYGKPYLEAPTRRLTFNVTYSGGYAVIASTWDSLIGVDLEVHRPMHDVRALARTVFSDGEREELDRAADPVRAFLNGWTRKEAYIKALGVGCSAPLTRISVSLDDAAALLSTETGRNSATAWIVLDLPHPHGIASVALGPAMGPQDGR